jgi:glycosyltransferase involved in cell wall biosynthesis
VYESTWLPTLYRPQWLRQYIFDARINYVRRLLARHGCQKTVLYLWRPEFGSALDSIQFDLSCYHIDDEYSFSDVEIEVDPRERALIAKVGQVFIHSPGLMEKKGAINPHTTLIPNGVAFDAYVKPAPEPNDLASIARPRIGYTGYLKKQLDWALILQLTKRHPEWSFVFVGPRSPHSEVIPAIEKLSSCSNVHFLGAKPSYALAAYPQHFDVCIMPYHVDAYTNKIYPLKLHEYLAGGRPVVSSPVRSLLDFSGIISLARGPEEWSAALTQALDPAALCPKAITVRREIARQYDWGTLVHSLALTLCQRLGPEYVDRFQQITPDN